MTSSKLWGEGEGLFLMENFDFEFEYLENTSANLSYMISS